MNNLEAWCSQEKLTMGLQNGGDEERPWNPISCILLWEEKFRMTSLNFLKVPQNLLSDPVKQCWIGMGVIGGRGRKDHKFKASLVYTARPCVKNHQLVNPFSIFNNVPLGQSL